MITPPPTSATVARSRSSGARSAIASACVTRTRSAPSPAAPATAAPGSSACTAPSVSTRRAGTEPIRSTTPSKPARARSYVFQNEAPIVCTVPCARWTIALTSPSCARTAGSTVPMETARAAAVTGRLHAASTRPSRISSRLVCTVESSSAATHSWACAGVRKLASHVAS